MIGRILIILVLQTIVLAAMVAMKQWTLATGRPVLLQTEPIDPRSLFRGDYVRLSYAISTLELNLLDGDDEFAPHDQIFVVLREGDRYWEPLAVYREFPVVGEDRVVVRGEVTYIRAHPPDSGPDDETGRTELLVRYGIESYFVPEGEGRELERPDEHRVDLGVVVDASGRAAIREVHVDGVVRYRETLL